MYFWKGKNAYTLYTIIICIGIRVETSAVLSNNGALTRNARFTDPCPRDESKFHERICSKTCVSDEDCGSKEIKCICDDACGLSCVQTDYCKYPGSIPNGRVLLVGNMGLYDYKNYLSKVANNRQIVFECDKGYTLDGGPQGKTCNRGEWMPTMDLPRCVRSESPTFRWIRSVRRKRRVGSKSSSVLRNNKAGGGGGGGGAPRRGTKRKNKQGEEDEYEFATPICDDLDSDPYLQIQVIQAGKAENQTFSAGAIVKVSCTQGFGVNLPNETVQCLDGRWKPKVPQCSALPCKAPYLVHGTYYNGSKAMVFQESVKHTKTIELKCSKGYFHRGPKNIKCWFGEWDVVDAPACLPIYDPGQDHHNVDGQRDKKRQGKDGNFRGSNSPTKRSCGSLSKVKGAIAYNEGRPIDHDTEFIFADSSEVLYKCVPVNLKHRTKNRWKHRCDDGKWTDVEHQPCEGDVQIEPVIQELVRMINSSCVHRKDEPHVVTFFQDQELLTDNIEFPTNTVLKSRCVDIGKFMLLGAPRRTCVSGQWFGVTPKCEGLSQYHDYALDKSPTILFRYMNGSVVQSTDGKLVVYPGTTLHMECLWLRRFGTPKWEISNTHRVYKEGWTEGEGRDSTLEFRLTIDNAQKEDSGTYRCMTPARHSHQIDIVVKSGSCKPLMEHPDLEYSTNETILGTRVTFKCRNKFALVGAQHIVCSDSGNWNAPLPKCENVECPDMSLLPPFPLTTTHTSTNGTQKKNITTLAKVIVISRAVGGKATFSCPDGFVVQGKSEATCQPNGDWTSNVPLCIEVECPEPNAPEYGFVSGKNSIYKAGDLAQFECNQGYMMEGQPIVACQDSGTWSRSSTLKCLPACSYPGSLIGGTISQVKFYYMAGETVTFDCTDGYTLHGTRTLHCLKSGNWSQKIPNCTPKSHDNAFANAF